MSLSSELRPSATVASASTYVASASCIILFILANSARLISTAPGAAWRGCGEGAAAEGPAAANSRFAREGGSGQARAVGGPRTAQRKVGGQRGAAGQGARTEQGPGWLGRGMPTHLRPLKCWRPLRQRSVVVPTKALPSPSWPAWPACVQPPAHNRHCRRPAAHLHPRNHHRRQTQRPSRLPCVAAWRERGSRGASRGSNKDDLDLAKPMS